MPKWAGREKEYLHEYYLSHKSEWKKKRKEYEEKNHDKIKEYNRQYYQEHKAELDAKNREWRKNNPERAKEMARARAKKYLLKHTDDPEYRRKRREGDKKWQQEHKSQRIYEKKATTAVSHAIRDGKLKKQPCEVCGERIAEAHHDDYNYPLVVRWLCKDCHAEWHRNNKPIRRLTIKVKEN